MIRVLTYIPSQRRVICAAVVMLLVFSGCTSDKPASVSYKYLRQVGGERARDCGYVHLGEVPSNTNQCVLDSYRSHQAFVARYDVQGLDSRLIVGLAGDGTGKVVSIGYDGEGWEQPRRIGSLLAEGNHVLLTPCPTPVHFQAMPRGYLSCYD
jgi:hypothetical protein